MGIKLDLSHRRDRVWDSEIAPVHAMGISFDGNKEDCNASTDEKIFVDLCDCLSICDVCGCDE